MDFPNTPLSSAGSGASADLQRELRVLRLTVNLTLVALVILSASLLLYFFRQVSLLRRQVEGASRTAAQVLKNYRENLEPQAVVFERQLKEFARTNADFQLILAKYYPPETGAAANPASGADAAAVPMPPPIVAPPAPAK